ncbi:DUF6907 domain-containing protein [Kocuria aegyptia]|uniref:Uncharacterized protein n=1 Tax=Kocuria aegyptia TaxID=330943 RepID=A0ABN2KUJ0_9MICC
MTDTERARERPGGRVRRSCPHWCVSGHGVHRGEEDWLHQGEPLMVARGVVARLCMSVNPDTGAVDGPYVLVGTTEHTLSEAEALGAALVALARTGTGPTPP